MEDLGELKSHILEKSNFHVFNSDYLLPEQLRAGKLVQFTTEDGSSFFFDITGHSSNSVFGNISRRGKTPEISPSGVALDEFDEVPVALDNLWVMAVGKRVLAYSIYPLDRPSFVTSPIIKGGLQLITPITKIL